MKEVACAGSERMRFPNRVHKDVRIDEDHTPGQTAYARFFDCAPYAPPSQVPGRELRRASHSSKKQFQVVSGFEPSSALLRFKPFTGGGPEPLAEAQALLACLMNEPVPVFIRDYQLDPGHCCSRPTFDNVYVSYTLSPSQVMQLAAITHNLRSGPSD